MITKWSAFGLFGVLLLGVAQARNMTGVEQPELSDWFNSLSNQKGTSCCSTADGWKPDEVQYDTEGGHYRVRLFGKWWDVPADAVLNVPNRAGYAIVWFSHRDAGIDESGTLAPEYMHIRCFLPGAGI